MTALELIAAERARQIAKGFTHAHDDEHSTDNALLRASVEYLQYVGHSADEFVEDPEAYQEHGTGAMWPAGWPWNPESPIRDLVKGLALGVAELERRLRLQTPDTAAE